MLRIFRHYVALPIIFWAAAEAALFALILFVVAQLSWGADLARIAEMSTAQARHGLAAVIYVLLLMISLGLYNRESFYNIYTFWFRASVGALVILVTAGILHFLTTYFLELTFSQPFAVFVTSVLAFFPLIFLARQGYNQLAQTDIVKRRVAVLGSGPLAERIAELAEKRHGVHFVTVGHLSFNGRSAAVGAAVVLPEDLAAVPGGLADFARQNRVDEIVLAARERRGLPIWELLDCKLDGVKITDYIEFWERETGQIDINEVRPSWLIHSDGFRVSLLRRFIKRTFDIVVSGGLLLLTLPLLLVTACLIRLDSRGPVLYKQERVGLNGRIYEVLKFRTMRSDAESGGQPVWARTRDDRVTHVGAFLRRARIDEIPQMFNVLKGDMSFIGPRPERPYFVNMLSDEIPLYDLRHRVRPGITGWAQINYPYGASVEDAKAKHAYDLYYVKNGGLFLDLVVLMQTVRVVLFFDGAR